MRNPFTMVELIAPRFFAGIGDNNIIEYNTSHRRRRIAQNHPGLCLGDMILIFRSVMLAINIDVGGGGHFVKGIVGQRSEHAPLESASCAGPIQMGT